MKQADIVIGLNYGDEGKGRIVNHIIYNNNFDSGLVVRFNGGAQAGHTVVNKRFGRHVFHQFGSGTFRGYPTLLSRFHLVCPYLFRRELQELKDKGLTPKMYIDSNAMVVTPFDIIVNQWAERARGHLRHGSCGGGIGETVQRNETGYVFTTQHLTHSSRQVYAQLMAIFEEYIKPRIITELNLINADSEELAILEKEAPLIIDKFIQDCSHLISNVELCIDSVIMSEFDHVVFEGAQGLLLDQDSNDFPYVTRSYTGLTNVVALLRTLPDVITNVNYVTRSYLTRHGAGPLKNEYFGELFILDETNIHNEFQGHLRVAPLDLDRMRKAVAKDLSHLKFRKIDVFGYMTWCDVYEKIRKPIGDGRLLYELAGLIHEIISPAKEIEMLSIDTL